MRTSPANIQAIGDQLAIKWNDGTETFLPLEFLRKACPCAACGGEPDVMGRVVRPQVTHTPASFRLKSWQLVGSYALQPAWEDGHATGLYTFPYLKQLEAESAAANNAQ
jgi:DUF971 family protein